MNNPKDDLRAKAIEMMMDAFLDAVLDVGGTVDYRVQDVMTAAFDSMHGMFAVNETGGKSYRMLDIIENDLTKPRD